MRKTSNNSNSRKQNISQVNSQLESENHAKQPGIFGPGSSVLDISIKQKIVKRAVVFFLPLFLLFLLLTVVILFVNERAEMQEYQNTEMHTVALQAANIDDDIRNISSELTILANWYDLRGLRDDTVDPAPEKLESLGKDFLLISKYRQLYDQVRLLDENGQEIVRVNFNNGHPALVTGEKLQNKKGRYYFDDAFKLNRGELFISPLDLNIEHGKIEKPLKPMIRFAAPVFDLRNKKRGIVLFNYFGAKLIERFSGQADISRGSQAMLLNGDGYWLQGPNPDDQWGFMYKNRKNRTFGNKYPASWEQIASKEACQFENSFGLFTSKTVYPLLEGQKSSTGAGEAFAPSVTQLEANDYYWKIVSFIPSDVLYSVRNQRRMFAALILGFLSVIIFLGSWWMARVSILRRKAEEDLRSAYGELEGMVEERTKELYEIAENLRTTLNSIGDAVISTDTDGNIIGMNPIAEYLTGWEIKDAKRKLLPNVFNVVNAKTGKKLKNPVQKVINEGEIVGLANHTMLRSKNGKEYQIADSGAPIRDAKGNVTGVVLVFRDVTEEYKMQEELRASEERKRSFMDSAKDGYHLLDENLNILEINKPASDAVIEAYDHMNSKEDIIGKNILDIYPFMQQGKYAGIYKKVIETGNTYSIEDKVFHPKHGDDYIYAEVFKTREGLGIIASKITEQKQAEKALRESEEKYRLLADNQANVIWTRDLDLKLTYISPSTFQQNGFSVSEKMKQPLEESMTPESLEMITRVLGEELELEKQETADPKRSRTLELEMYRKDGSTYPVEITVSFLRNNTGDAIGLLGINRDITERKRSEKALRESEERLSKFINSAENSYHILDKELRILEINRGALEALYTGYPNFNCKEDVIGQNFKELYPFLKNEIKHISKVIRTGERYSNELIVLHPEYDEMVLSYVCFKVGDGVGIIAENITERKHAEKALQESERRFRELANLLPQTVWELDVNGYLTFVNDEGFKTFGYSQDDLEIGKHSLSLFVLDHRARALSNSRKTMDGEDVGPAEYLLLKKDNTTVPVLMYMKPIIREGKTVGLRGIHIDITERKKAEQQIKNDLKEKTMLLGEVHHRVKNSLQLVSSLLHLQSRKVTDKQILDLFQQSRNRIKMMAAVYEKLYQSENFASIDIKEYLADVLNKIYQTSGISHRVSLKLNVKHVVLGLDDATPVSLIINELFTNSVKHAFPEDRKGIIEINFSLLDKEIFQLIYRDNGVGLADDIDFETAETLGLNLIKNLSKQIEGEMIFEQTEWATFKIEFRGYGYGKKKFSQ